MILYALIGAGTFALSYAYTFFSQVARGEKLVSVRRRMPAEPAHVWERILDGSTANVLPDMPVQRRHDDEDPDLIETRIDFDGGSSRRLERIVVNEPAERYVLHTEEIDGTPEPYGSSQWEGYALRPTKKGTEISVAAQGSYGSVISAFRLWLALRRRANRLKALSTPKAPQLDVASAQNDILISIMATASFIFLFGIDYALILVPLLLLHEYGHFLAMQLTGQPAPRMLLVPFFGGIAVPNQPHKSAFHDAFVSLMGPGLSLVATVGLYLAGTMVLPQPYAWWAITAAGICGFLNAFNLLPALPLDGGHVVRTLCESVSPGTARYALMALGAACALLMISKGFIGFAMFMGLGLMNAMQMSGHSKYPPLSFFGGSVILIGYLLAAAIHVGVYMLVFGF